METIRPEQLKAIDSPNNNEVPSYDSATGKFEWVVVSGGTGSSTFLDLNDTPNSYTGQGGKSVVVNEAEDGLEFTTISGGIAGHYIQHKEVPQRSNLNFEDAGTVTVTVTDDSGNDATIVTISGSGGTGSSIWTNVKDYGATGNGITDDTSAISDALADIVTASGGVLYFPHGTYYTTGNFSLTVPITVVGDGSSSYFDEDVDDTTNTKILCDHDTNSLFIVNSWGCNFRDFLARCIDPSPTDGAAITVNNGDFVHYNNLNLQSFYIDLDIEDGADYFIDACIFYEPVLYGLKMNHPHFGGDFGDNHLSNMAFFPGDRNSTAAIYISAGGGIKIVNTTISGWYTGPPAGTAFNYGIYIHAADGVHTILLQLSNSTIENVAINAVRITNAVGATWKHILLNNTEFGMYAEETPAIYIAADTPGDIEYIVINNCTFLKSTASSVFPIQLTNINHVRIGNVVIQNYDEIYSATNCLDVVVMDQSKLDDWDTPDNNTDLNATIAYHGLLPRLSGSEFEFLNGMGQWITVSGYVYSGTPGITQSYVKELIYDNTLTLDGTWGLSIPQTYDHLEVMITGRTDAMGVLEDAIKMEANGDTTDNHYRIVEHYATDTHSFGNADGAWLFPIAANLVPSGWNGYGTAFIPFYRMDTNADRMAVGRGYHRITSTMMKLQEISWEWENTNAITSLAFKPAYGTYIKAGSRIQVFGLVEKAQGGAVNFTDLQDVPNDYTGHASQLVKVNAGEDGLDFVTISGAGVTFLNLDDTPNSYSGQAGKSIRVNSGEDALEFITVSGLTIDYPDTAFHFFSEFKKDAGTWTTLADGADLAAGAAHDYFENIWYQDVVANGDAAKINVILESGTYDFKVWGRKSNNLGIVDWSMDGTNFITGEDWYNASAVYGTTFTGTVTIATSGKHILKVTTNGKNASSSDYYWLITAVQLRKQ